MDYQKINWIASYPKSGNTWLRLFLDAYLLNEVDINEILCTVTDDRADRIQMDGGSVAALPVDIQHLARPMGLLNLVRAYSQHGKNEIPLMVKTHTAHMLVNGVELLPMSLTKSVVYIVRDPRDVVVSFAKHMGVSIDTAIDYMTDKYRTLTSTKDRMADFLSSWEMNVNSYLNADTHNVRVFTYEAMKDRPMETFSDILTHIGITPDPTQVEKALEMVNISKLREREKKEGFRESSHHAKDQFFGPAKVGGWKEVLTDTQRYRIERKFHRLMKRLGYDKARAA
jgi:hypothetical protein